MIKSALLLVSLTSSFAWAGWQQTDCTSADKKITFHSGRSPDEITLTYTVLGVKPVEKTETLSLELLGDGLDDQSAIIAIPRGKEKVIYDHTGPYQNTSREQIDVLYTQDFTILRRDTKAFYGYSMGLESREYAHLNKDVDSTLEVNMTCHYYGITAP